MKLKRILVSVALVAAISMSAYAADKKYQVTSPDGTLSATVNVGEKITYTLQKNGKTLILPSEIAMTMESGLVFGLNDKVRKVKKSSADNVLDTDIYKRAQVTDKYNEIELIFKEFTLVFRAYDESVSYRFRSNLGTEEKVVSETAQFAFAEDWKITVPYVRDKGKSIESQYFNSFENIYSESKISEWEKERLAFLPLVVSADNGVKVLVTEADLLSYPGMYLYNDDASTVLDGNFAPYPKDVVVKGHNQLQGIVTSREDYIAIASPHAEFPWRVMMVTENDIDLAVNDVVWKLSTPAQGDYGWVKPGKVAWDWWNKWNLYGVDFRAGVNNETYKYYIDFAAANKIEYVILDEGWSVNGKADLMLVVPEIDLKMLSKYASEKGVGLILWAGYMAFAKDMENVCRHYSEMGIKGFKVDFMDRDDQAMVDFYVKAAQTASKYKLMVDFHGAYKPTGLHRTYPNVVNFEGVNGLEQLKWSSPDQVKYDVLIPFIRMAAGPMDYTQGAMRNATKENFRWVDSEAMSQGTRCRQLAEYVVFESPLNMLCDSPSNYMSEPECTKYIAECPVVWDESVGVNGVMGEYVTIARRSSDVWYVGALTDWTARDMVIDMSFLGEGEWTMEIFRDGVNADHAARDFKHEFAPVPGDRQVKVHLAPGGGWTARIVKI